MEVMLRGLGMSRLLGEAGMMGGLRAGHRVIVRMMKGRCSLVRASLGGWGSRVRVCRRGRRSLVRVCRRETGTRCCCSSSWECRFLVFRWALGWLPAGALSCRMGYCCWGLQVCGESIAMPEGLQRREEERQESEELSMVGKTL